MCTMRSIPTARCEVNWATERIAWTALALSLTNTAAMIAALMYGWTYLRDILAAALLALITSTLNISALGFMLWALLTKGFGRWVVFLPLSSFLLMCLSSWLVIAYRPSLSLGFAIGLASPLVYGLLLALRKPA